MLGWVACLFGRVARLGEGEAVGVRLAAAGDAEHVAVSHKTVDGADDRGSMSAGHASNASV